MCMMKKVVIAGLAVAVGVAVLAWISPPLFDWLVHQGKALKDGAEDSIPLEQRIDVLQGKLKDIKNNKAKYYDQAAKAKDDVDADRRGGPEGQGHGQSVAGDAEVPHRPGQPEDFLLLQGRHVQQPRGREEAEAGTGLLRDR